jgi:hypothetical protein
LHFEEEWRIIVQSKTKDYMPIRRNPLTLLFLILSSFFLTGCSFIQYFHVLNTTDKIVTAIIKFAPPTLNSCYPEPPNSILNECVRERLGKKLKFKALDEFTISVDFPPKSKTYIGHSTNRPLRADSVIIIKDEKKEYYSFTDIYIQATGTESSMRRNVTYKIK